MLHIFNKTISNKNKILYSLIDIYGINKYQSKKICQKIGVNTLIKINKLKKNQLNNIVKYIKKNLKIEYLLKIYKKKIILKKYLKTRRCIATRLLKGYPVRGQRTRSNAKTSKKLKFSRHDNFLNENIIRKKSNLKKHKYDRKKKNKKI